MKITKEEPDFKPVSIILETQKELDDFNKVMLVGFNKTPSESDEEYLAKEILQVTSPDWA